jgi:hypothetical protein
MRRGSPRLICARSNLYMPARAVKIQALLTLALLGLVACQSPPTTATNPAAAKQSASYTGRSDVPPRDLSQDEAAGGHILRKHVGRTDDELLERLNRERNISGASTYTDRTTAERTVGAAIAQSQDRINRWVSRSGGHPNLVLDYDSDQPVGRTINRGDTQSHPCSHALIVLKYKPPSGYYVLTSYPECR